MIKQITFLILFLISLFGCTNSRNQYGASIYKTYCQNCHMENGDGLGGLIPPLKNADYFSSKYSEISCIIKYGIKDTISVNGTIYENPMMGIDNLSDIQISNLINFLRDRWYPDLPLMTPDKVRVSLNSCN